MAEFETRSDAQEAGGGGAIYWRRQLALADRVEKNWRKDADDLQERFRHEKSKDSSTRLNIFYSNVVLLQTATYSQTPVPSVQRRAIFEDPITNLIGKTAAQVLEKALVYEIDQ